MNELTRNKDQSNQNYCSYYQAQILKERVWYVVAILKSFDHLAFDRTIDIPTSTFEFFVPQCNEQQFLKVMDCFLEQGLVSGLKKLPNRLEQLQ